MTELIDDVLFGGEAAVHQNNEAVHVLCFFEDVALFCLRKVLLFLLAGPDRERCLKLGTLGGSIYDPVVFHLLIHSLVPALAVGSEVKVELLVSLLAELLLHLFFLSL